MLQIGGSIGRLVNMVAARADEPQLWGLINIGIPRAADRLAELLVNRHDANSLRQLRNVGISVQAADYLLDELGGPLNPPAGLTYDGTALHEDNSTSE